MEDYLYSLREVSDSIYYDVIKDRDLTKDDIEDDMNLLYESNNSRIVSCAIFDSDGQMLFATPNSKLKSYIDVSKQEWFKNAVDETENLHYSLPHIQNLFDDSGDRFKWVISLSRAVEITINNTPKTGVLLIDMDYFAIDNMIKGINKSDSDITYYLADSRGQLISHPEIVEIKDGFRDENNKALADYYTGKYEEVFKGHKRTVLINTVSYTGWKMVAVIPSSAFRKGMMNIRLFIMMAVALTAFMVLLINRIVARRISLPILKLDEAVKSYESGSASNIYIGGSTEIRHLGDSIRKNYEKIELLIHDIKREQDERRRSELEALQSQINPHFLYNTLDSITWMIEGEKNEEAVFMIQQLARLFRISLSKGKTIISIEDEIKHAESYMNIQKVRYKDSFSIEFDIDKVILDKCTVKLIIQPILENAIYYGVNQEEEDGEIRVRGYEQDGDIYIEVSDNGYGMPEDYVEQILTTENPVKKKGSGVGILNVHNRLKLLFGEKYGVSIKSILDEGTTVTLHLPSIPYTEENRDRLEKPGKEDAV
jgi:two-component system sensor histidine kinase YesM